MKHPIIKLFLARLRAAAAAERSVGNIGDFSAIVGPFSNHMLRLALTEEGMFIITEVGEGVRRLFGREVLGLAAADLFQEADRPRLKAILAATTADEVGCVFGAKARHSQFRSTVIEAMIAPEKSAQREAARSGVCILAFGFPAGWDRDPLPPLALTSERFIDLDRRANVVSWSDL